MARRRPRTFQAWAIGLIGTIITALIMYYGRLAIIEHMTQRQLEHTQAAIQKIQAQQGQRQQHQPVQQPQRQTDAYDAQVMKAAAESQRKHDEAWDSYYKQPRGCDNWKTDQQMVECVNHRMRAKDEFERKWATGEIDAQQG